MKAPRAGSNKNHYRLEIFLLVLSILSLFNSLNFLSKVGTPILRRIAVGNEYAHLPEFPVSILVEDLFSFRDFSDEFRDEYELKEMKMQQISLKNARLLSNKKLWFEDAYFCERYHGGLWGSSWYDDICYFNQDGQRFIRKHSYEYPNTQPIGLRDASQLRDMNYYLDAINIPCHKIEPLAEHKKCLKLRLHEKLRSKIKWKSESEIIAEAIKRRGHSGKEIIVAALFIPLPLLLLYLIPKYLFFLPLWQLFRFIKRSKING